MPPDDDSEIFIRKLDCSEWHQTPANEIWMDVSIETAHEWEWAYWKTIKPHWMPLPTSHELPEPTEVKPEELIFTDVNFDSVDGVWIPKAGQIFIKDELTQEMVEVFLNAEIKEPPK